MIYSRVASIGEVLALHIHTPKSVCMSEFCNFVNTELREAKTAAADYPLCILQSSYSRP